ncbi:transcriptional regulator with HTH domain and aminotransferase domain [Desulfosporosinus orientis DSM 765]|uniref:Transcriptional regulator with HTH domain and aminotransferase domain n=1 Tax=Desulfosporosinus orientis (strain ATCC 19365 / DSM 765 / NCIMB 8382 / VKM B-1628 / Singapore I) TaxID=768706 RepID=G7WC12_DESOD|nr:PLP-dependent aminotransferase family protein [Desulfosporosinus orientis]AET69986.1 transcriptional regulator with HTH domain and aminotransferase domain [Desulfosporosinus orientis DSM 765]
MKLKLDRSLKTPLYLQIRDQIGQLILSQQLSPGYRLPPERKLAAQLGVNRTTIVNAYHELAADGLIQSHVGRGSMVCIHPTMNQDRIPIQPVSWQNYYSSQAERMHNPVLASILDEISEEDQISFALGAPAGEYYPLKELNEICKAMMHAGNWQAFAYGPTIGHLPLREYLADWLRLRGIKTQAQNILITSGSQQGLDLLTKIFLEPGDFIVMEEPSFLGAIGVFKTAGAHILTIPLDEEGIRTDILEQILSRRRPKFIYTLPTFQNPTGTTMSLARRHELLKLAYQFHVPIIEDDPYSELYYEQGPFPSLKSLDEHEHVIYLGTFSKMLLPGLRLGWCVAPTTVLEQLSLAKQHVDLHTSTTTQWIMTDFCNQGMLDQHLSLVRNQYKRQRDIMADTLTEFSPPGLSWVLPSGGYYLWCELPPGINATSLLRKAAEKKVSFVPGNAFHIHSGGKNLIRLCFCHHTEATIREGIYRLCTAISELLNQPSQGRPAHRHHYRETLV